MYFSNYGLPKAWLDKCLKLAISQYPWTSNMVNAPKHSSNLSNGSFTIFVDYCEVIEFEKVTLSDMKNLKTVC